MKNVFDFTITILAIISTAIIYYPNDYSDSRLIRMILSARVLRLIRLLTALQPFQHIGKISAVILPAAKNVLIVLFITMYIFALLGMHLYGGMITRDPNNPLSFLLLNTDFSRNEYWVNNFNDMIGGMNVLFNLLVVNNWFVCEEGYEAVTQSKWVRLFFLCFHVFGVILVNNLVIAFIINKFLLQMAHLKHQSAVDVEHIGQAVHIGEDSAIFDASKVTGTVTNVHGNYIARFRHSRSDIEDDHCDRDRFRTLFTQS
jgi:two pore calcium channel protein